MAFAKLFSGVGIEAVSVFLERCTIWSAPTGTLVISPESLDKTLYIILEGSVSVRLEDRDDAALTELGKGQCIGEMSIIEDAPPSAFVTTRNDCRFFMIDQQTVWDLISGSHGVARNLLEVLSQRLRFDNDHIVDRSELVEQNRRNAITDALTDLHNRYWMQVMFARKIDRARSNDSNLSLAVLDLDRFKAFNDKHGHQKGDVLLQGVATALRDLFRPTDLIARFGGDEFAVLLPDTTLHQAALIGSRVREGTGTVRSSNRRVPGAAMDAGRHVDRYGRITRAHLQRGPQCWRRFSRHANGGTGKNSRLRNCNQGHQ